MAVLDVRQMARPPLREDKNGVIRVGDTRVTLDTLLAAYDDGAGAEEIVLEYPVLDLATVHSVIGFCLSHRAEVDAYLAAQAEFQAEARAEAERRWPSAGVRERLVARQVAGTR